MIHIVIRPEEFYNENQVLIVIIIQNQVEESLLLELLEEFESNREIAKRLEKIFQ